MYKRIILIVLIIFTAAAEALGQWQFANGPYYSDIKDLVIDPQHPETLYAATAIGNGLYKSINGGENWITMEIDSSLAKVYALAMAPDDANIIYAGGDRGIDKTEDGGNSWCHLDLNHDIYALAINPTDNSVVYAGTVTKGVLKSIDEGFTWESMNNGLPEDTLSGFRPWVRSIAINPINPEEVYIGTYDTGLFSLDGLYKSTNAGSSWVYMRFDNHFFYDIALDPLDPNIVYVATNQGLYRSLDGGSNWTAICYAATSIAVDPHNSQRLYCGIYGFETAIYLSTDRGTTWTNISGDLRYRAADVRAIVINPQNPDLIYLGTGIGVYKAVDTSYHWTLRNQGFSKCASFLNVVESNTGAVIYVGAEGVHKSTDGGQTWSYAGLFYPTALAAAPSSPDLVFGGEVTVMGGALWRSTDGGLSWEYTGLSTPTFITVIAIDPFNSNLVYVGGFAKSYNGGDDWEACEGPGTVVNNIIIQSQNTQILYAGTWSGLYKSINEGISWDSLGLGDKDVWTVAVDPLDAQVMYAAVRGEGIFKSTDAGSTWFESNDGLTNAAVRSIIIHPHYTDRIYAGIEGGGVSQSFNAGMSWTGINESLDNLNVFGLAFDPRDPNRIYAATGGGVSIYTETSSIEPAPSQKVPSSFSLFQNYPNPFNFQTRIRFQIPDDYPVFLTIYDVLGREVTTLVKEHLPKGGYASIWDGKDAVGRSVSSGLYFCQLRAGQLKKTIKMLLLK